MAPVGRRGCPEGLRGVRTPIDFVFTQRLSLARTVDATDPERLATFAAPDLEDLAVSHPPAPWLRLRRLEVYRVALELIARCRP